MRISDWSSDVCSSDLQGLDVETYPVHERQYAFQTLGVCAAAVQSYLESQCTSLAYGVGQPGIHCGFSATEPDCVYKSAPALQQGQCIGPGYGTGGRSEERRVGKGCVSPCRSWWSSYNKKKK